MKPKWLVDLESFVDSVKYGKVDVGVDRANSHTIQISTIASETLRYTDNKECVGDLIDFIASLLDEEHTGNVQFSLDMKKGQINLLTIKNTKKMNY